MGHLKSMIMHRRSINKLLIALVLLTALSPAHYHLHHLGNDEPASHDHAIDLHFITIDTDPSHHNEDTSIFAATPDVIVKKSLVPVHTFVLLTIVLVLLARFHRATISTGYGDKTPVQHAPYFTPPLRAPPLA